jgi:hypothetical protein
MFFVAVIFGWTSCLGGEQKHIEQSQYQPEPELTRPVLISTFSGSSPTLTNPGRWINGSQFT